jgi:hypothetical protein
MHKLWEVEIDEGRRWRFTATYTIDGVIVDLTGWSATMRMADEDTGETIFTTDSTGIGFIALTGGLVPEHVVVDIPASTMDNLTEWNTVRHALFDIKLQPATGPDDAITLVRGRARIFSKVTS